ncbi:unnamed protein product [Mytilus edulis]|uniref:IgGFc-binding protein N-terminal domain-containing protein n=1 Tax=Mytilus edulis TaxID=6550 RepID=A0A8S3U377_MYTED|nr:unnamed protein product [Mytilus edulis]
MCGQSKRTMLMNSSYVESDFSRSTDHSVDCMKCCSSNMCNSVGCGAPDFPAQRGPVCLSCNLTPDPSICHSVSVCETNEVCNPSEVSHGFGKRDIHSSRTTHSCCSTDLCNNIGNMSMATTIHSTTVTTKTTPFQTSQPSKIDLVQPTTDKHIDTEHYRHIYIIVASEEKGWMVIQSSVLPKTLNKTLNRGKTIIELPKVLKSSNTTTIENKGIHLISSVPVSVFGYNEEATNKEGFYVIPADSLSTEYMALSYTPIRGSDKFTMDCSPLREQLIPIEKWGKEFIVPSLNFEKPESILRIVVNVSNTRISVVSNTSSTFRSLSHGDFMDIIMTSDGPFYISSSQPVMIAIVADNAFGEGYGMTSNGFLTLVPSFSQYKENYTFVVPYMDMTEANNYFVYPEITCGTTRSNMSGTQRFISITVNSNFINSILYDDKPLSNNLTVKTIRVGDKAYSTVVFPVTGGFHTLKSAIGKRIFGAIVYAACWTWLYGFGFPIGLNL